MDQNNRCPLFYRTDQYRHIDGRSWRGCPYYARQYGEQSFKKSDKEVNLADEMADVLFVLICLANQTGIDLTDALEKNLEKKSIRDADRHKNNEKLK